MFNKYIYNIIYEDIYKWSNTFVIPCMYVYRSNKELIEKVLLYFINKQLLTNE